MDLEFVGELEPIGLVPFLDELDVEGAGGVALFEEGLEEVFGVGLFGFEEGFGFCEELIFLVCDDEEGWKASEVWGDAGWGEGFDDVEIPSGLDRADLLDHGLVEGPIHGDLLFAVLAVAVEEEAVFGAEFVEEFGDFDVVTAVFSDFAPFALAEPADGIEAIGDFADAEGGGGEGVESDAAADAFFEVEHEVVGAEEGAEVENGVSHEDGVIEVEEVEADDEVGFAEFVNEFLYFPLGVDVVGAAKGAEGDAEGHFEEVFAVPSADVSGDVLGFEVEVNDIFWHGGDFAVFWRGKQWKREGRKIYYVTLCYFMYGVGGGFCGFPKGGQWKRGF